MSAPELHNADAVAEGGVPPRRQHPAGVIRYFVRYIWMFVRSFWPVLAGLAVSDAIKDHVWHIALAALAVVCVASWLQYWRFTFEITADSLVIRKGVLERERITIAFERIQMVHLEQSLWQRPLGVLGLRVDTAGSSGAEVEISALTLADAKRLKAILNPPTGKPSEVETGRSSEEEEGAQRTELISLSWNRLFKIGLTQNHLRNALIAFGSVVAFAEPAEETIKSVLTEIPDYAWFLLKLLWVLLLPVFAMGIVAVGVLISLVGAVIRYYQLTVQADEEGLELSGGLLKRFEYKIPIHKVQLLEGTSGVLQRLVGFESFNVHQARAQAEQGQSGVNLVIPGLESDHALRLQEVLFPAFEGRQNELRPHPIWLVRMLAIRLLLVAVAWSAGTGGWRLLAAAWALWLVASCLRRFQNQRLVWTSSQVVLRSGWLKKRMVRAELRKMQRVVVTDNWVMRRRNLVHIRLHSAAGPVVMRYVPKNEAEQLRNRALVEVESRRERWM
jgi:putative membrane protein